MPGTSFHRTTRLAPRARPSRVAVRSDPPRPSVATLPSGACPMKPGTTGTVPCATDGFSRRLASVRRVRDERRRSAVDVVGADDVPCVDELRATTCRRDGSGQHRGRQFLAAAHHRVAGPRLEVAQHADGPAQFLELRRGAVDLGEQLPKRPPIPGGRLRGGLMPAAERLGGLFRGHEPARRRVGSSVEQEIGDAAERRGHDDERAFVRGNAHRGPLDRLAVGERRTAELPHFQCVLTSLHDSTPSSKKAQHEDHEDATKVTKERRKRSRCRAGEVQGRKRHRGFVLFVCFVSRVLEFPTTAHQGSPCAAAATPPLHPARSYRRDAASS